MKSADVLAVLKEFHREKLAMRHRHVAVAKHVSNYEFNNTYQYIIAREDTQLAWLEAAIVDLGGTPDRIDPTDVPAPGKREGFTGLIDQDRRDAGAFVDRWRTRADELSHARDRKLLELVLGETLEHKRFFDQMMAGRDDLLGRRTGGKRTGDGVLPVRWMN